jgi:prolyl-tRNA synthetase
MKYSQIFSKTIKNAKEYDSANATLLIKAGFMSQTMSGVYTFLPLGMRVLHKIENIVREEMDKIGVEILMPSLAPKKMWQDTGRLDIVDVLFMASGANDKSRELNSAEYILNPTHEEIVTPLAMGVRRSYKDFPFAIYQIQTKFRNEARPKSGLLRSREFRMKDLYSFHTSLEDLEDYYEKSKDVYYKVFNRLGIGEDTVIAAASGGDFTNDFSHEFQTICKTGEDTIFIADNEGVAFNKEVAPARSVLPEQDKDIKEIEYKEEAGVIGVDDLCEAFGIEAYQSVKTLIFETDTKGVVVAAIRGDYDINEEKLMKIVGVKKMRLASVEVVKETTGAEIGYAGILNLPNDVIKIFDESIEGLINFECGANKTDFHVLNVNWGRDLEKPEKFYDIKTAKEGDLYPETDEEYRVESASEVGNIFPLNTKFSKAIGYTYTDENGEEKPVYMGCYGLGTTRALGVIAEKFNDEKGLIWPVNIAPFKVHVISLVDEDIFNTEAYIKSLEKAGYDVFWDDRSNVSAGEKFADADLIGCPVRIVIGKKGLENHSVEIKARDSKDVEFVPIDESVNYIEDLLD